VCTGTIVGDNGIAASYGTTVLCKKPTGCDVLEEMLDVEVEESKCMTCCAEQSDI